MNFDAAKSRVSKPLLGEKPDSMWFCPDCEAWVGSELDECLEGHSRPRRPVLSESVGKKPAWEVTFADRVRAKLLGRKQ